jgi:hypothetical protein
MSRIKTLKRQLTKRADGNDGNDSSFEQAMSDLADIVLRDRAPALKQYELGFQLLDRDEDNDKAVGVKVFKVGKTWLFAPVFFLKGRIKGTELLYIKQQKIFVPLQEDWIRYILNKQTNPVGKPVTRNLGQLGVSVPDLRQISRPPTKFADDSGHGRPEGRVVKRSCVLPPYAKAVLDTDVLPAWHASMRQDPLKKVAINLPDFLIAEGQPAVLALWGMVREFPKLAEDLDRFHGDRLRRALKIAAAKPGYVAPALLYQGENLIRAEEHPIKSGALEVTTYDKALEEDDDVLADPGEDKKPDLRKGPLIKDRRSDDQVSTPYSLDPVRQMQNPTQTGIYDVLLQPNAYEKCLVVIGAKTTNGRMQAAVLVRLSDKASINVHPTKVWVGRHYEDPEWSDWFGGLPEAKSLEERGEADAHDSSYKADLFIGPNGDATAPFRSRDEIGSTDDGTAYRVYFETYRSHDSKPFPYASDAHQRERCDLTYDSDAVINVGTSRGGKIWSAEGNMYIPDGFKKLTLTYPPHGESMLQVSSPTAVTLGLVKKTTGLKVAYVHDRVKVNDKMLRETDALVHLVVDHGFREAAAREIMKRAGDVRNARDNVFECRVKYANPYLTDTQPGAPPIIDPMMTMEQTLTGMVPGMPNQSYSQPVTDMRPSPDNASAYDLRMPPVDAMQEQMGAVQQAAQSGQKEVFDTSLIGGMLQTTQGDLQVDKHLGALMGGLDAKGQVLMNFYWHGDDFAERYGKDDLVSLEDMLRNTFINDGKLILNLKQKGVEDPLDTQRDLELESASDQ